MQANIFPVSGRLDGRSSIRSFGQSWLVYRCRSVYLLLEVDVRYGRSWQVEKLELSAGPVEKAPILGLTVSPALHPGSSFRRNQIKFQLRGHLAARYWMPSLLNYDCIATIPAERQLRVIFAAHSMSPITTSWKSTCAVDTKPSSFSQFR